MKIKVNNKTISFFNNFTVKMTYNAIASTFSFEANFNPNSKLHRELYRPLAYQDIQVFNDNGFLVLTGTIVNISFKSSSRPSVVRVSGYSKGGILEDVTIPLSDYPLEKNNVSLKDVTKRLIGLFGLTLFVDTLAQTNASLIYEKTVASPTETIIQYLSKLTSQKNILLSHDVRGNIVFFQLGSIGRPQIFLNQTNATKMNFTIRGQGMHRDISVIRQPSIGNNNLTPEDTVVNELVQRKSFVVKTLSSGTDTDTSKAADNILATELMNMVLNITIPEIKDLLPGDLIDVQNEDLFLFKKTSFMIKGLTLIETSKSKVMEIEAVLPESFSGLQPKNIFSI